MLLVLLLLCVVITRSKRLQFQLLFYTETKPHQRQGQCSVSCTDYKLSVGKTFLDLSNSVTKAMLALWIVLKSKHFNFSNNWFNTFHLLAPIVYFYSCSSLNISKENVFKELSWSWFNLFEKLLILEQDLNAMKVSLPSFRTVAYQIWKLLWYSE